MQRRKVAIVGYTEHRALAPFGNEDWEIWGLNDLYYELPEIPADRLRWFQMHSWDDSLPHDPDGRTRSPVNFQNGPPHPRDPNHVPWLREQAQRIPIYMLEPRPEVPDARIFPLDEACRFFSLDGRVPNRYFTNTISYMLALAIMEGFTEIGVYGVDMMMGGGAGSEYGWQRPSCEFFLGWARAAGIVCYLPAESDLLKCAYPYGLSSGNAFRKKVVAVANGYRQRRADAQAQRAQMDAANSELTGAIQSLEWVLSSLMPGDGEGSLVGRVPVPNSHKTWRPVAPQLPDTPPVNRLRGDPDLEEAVLDILHRRVVLQPSDGRDG